MTALFGRVVFCLALTAGLTFGGPGGGKRGGGQPVMNAPCNDVPAHLFDVVLGRPTRDSVTASVLFYQDAEGSIAYGTQPEALTSIRAFRKAQAKRGATRS